MRLSIQRVCVLLVFLFATGLIYAQPRGPGGGAPGGGPGGGFAGGAPGAPDMPDAPMPHGPAGFGGGYNDFFDADNDDRDGDPYNDNADDADADDGVQSYHGKRMLTTSQPFAVVDILATKKAVRIIFNSPIDPRTFTRNTILLNDKPLPVTATIRFNRSGKLVECVFAVPKNEAFTIGFKDVQSFDGKFLQRTIFPDLKQGMSKHYLDAVEE